MSTVRGGVDLFQEAARLQALPPYVFQILDQKKAEARARGVDVIDLGMGNPDLPTPPSVVEAGARAVHDPINHRYPTFDGKLEFREAIAEWFQAHYGVALDPAGEILPLLGSKEGIAHLALAFTNPGDLNLVPSPSYPVHTRGTILAGGEIETLPLLAERDFLIDFEGIDRAAAQRAKMLMYNYPHNPTAAVAEASFHEQAVAFAEHTNTMLVHDMAYAELAFDGHKPTSLMEVEGGKELGLEFHTFSKTFSMAGWRVGFVVGHRKAIAALTKVKSNMDYGLAPFIQDAARAALALPRTEVDAVVEQYRRRRDVVVDALTRHGYAVRRPRATMYVWMPVAPGQSSASFAERLIQEAGVVVTPGTAFGSYGEGYVRISLVQGEARLAEAMERLGAMHW